MGSWARAFAAFSACCWVGAACAAAGAGAETQTVDVAARLLANSPYKVEIASSDGNKVMVTNALTLERRRLWERRGIAALAFSPDGVWLYAVTKSGEVVAIDSDGGSVTALGKVPVRAGEQVVDAIGTGPADHFAVSVVLAGATGGPLACPHWTSPRRVLLRRPVAGGGTQLEAREGWPDDQRTPRTSVISPNTRWKASIVGPTLVSEARFGGNGGTISKSPLPAGASQIDWMRDSAGMAVLYPRRAASGCPAALGARFFRLEGGAWGEWTLPDSVDVARSQLPWSVAAAAPDGMRWLGVESRGVVLVEPWPRFRPRIALVAPYSEVWPKMRPGVRPLPALSGGVLRLAELLMESGDLDAAEDELQRHAASAPATAVAKVRARLAKLQDVRLRRVQELGLKADDVRSRKGVPLQAPAAAVEDTSEAVEPSDTATATTPAAP